MTNTPPSSNPQGWNPPPLSDPTAPPPPGPTLGTPTPAPPPGGQQSAPQAPTPAPDPALAWQASPPVSAQPMSGYPVSTPPPVPQQASPVGWMFGIGGVVLVLVLALGGILWMNGPSGTPTTSEDPTPSPTVEEEPTAPVDVDLITDPMTGLSFPMMPAPWSAPGQTEATGFTIAVGQQFLTEENWAAVAFVGELDTAGLQYTGPDALRQLAENLAQLTDASNYGDGQGNSLEGLRRDGDPLVTETTVGDLPAITMEYHLVWTDTLIEDKGETLIIVVIDIGDGRAAGFVSSLPDFAADQLDAVRAAVDGLQFV